MVRDYLLDQAREAENEAMKRLVPMYEVKSKDKVIGEYQRIQDLLPHIVKSMDIKQDQRIRVKVEGDGRKVGKFKKETMMSFWSSIRGRWYCSPTTTTYWPLPWEGRGMMISSTPWPSSLKISVI